MTRAVLDRAMLTLLRDRARRDVDAGLEHGGVEGCALAVAHGGELLWEEGFGAARADTPMLLLSITKTVLEAALWCLESDHRIGPEARVADFLPGFMGGAAPDLTLGMVRTHLGDFAWAPIDYPDCGSRERRLEAYRGWSRGGGQGKRYEYHPLSGGWVLADAIQSAVGTDYRGYLRDILGSIGLAGVGGVSLGEPVAEQRAVLRHRNYMAGYTPDPALRTPMAYGLDTVEGLALGSPGAGGVGTARGVALLYQAYLHNPGERWSPSVLADARHRIRVDGIDAAGRPMLRSLSFVQAGAPADRYGERTFFGPGVSAASFGHQGQGGQVAWADPATGLSFAYLTNTVVFPPGGCFHPRARELSSHASRLLGGV